jgi:hypothetical protein
MYRTRYTVYGVCSTIPGMQDHTAVPPMPVVGEITETTWDQVAEGQPVLLVRNGRPAAVIVDLDSWEEAELAAAQSA